MTFEEWCKNNNKENENVLGFKYIYTIKDMQEAYYAGLDDNTITDLKLEHSMMKESLEKILNQTLFHSKAVEIAQKTLEKIKGETHK